MSTFLITGNGRCGTMFLAQLLNKSPTWTVKHQALKHHPAHVNDPVPDRTGMPSLRITSHFAAQDGNYGESSPWFKHHALEADVDRKVVIIRNPMDIARSHARRGSLHWLMKCIREDFAAVDRLASSEEIATIRFERLFNSAECVDEMTSLAWFLGVDDLKVTEDDMRKKVNASPGNANVLPKDVEAKVHKATDWFTKKWGL